VLNSGGDDKNEDSFPGTPHGGVDGQPDATQAPTSAPGEPGPGHRAKVNKGLFKLLKVLGTPGADRFADEVRTRNYREYPLIPGEAERNPTLDLRMDKFRQRRKDTNLSRRGSFIHAGPSHQDGDDIANDNPHHPRRGTRGTLHDSAPGSRSMTPPSRVDSGADLTQHRAAQVTLQVPQRMYTSPRETTTMQIRVDPTDSPTHVAGPSVPTIIVNAAESESERS
jgi:hypothetical protein